MLPVPFPDALGYAWMFQLLDTNLKCLGHAPTE